jgi:hypothetical protein
MDNLMEKLKTTPLRKEHIEIKMVKLKLKNMKLIKNGKQNKESIQLMMNSKQYLKNIKHIMNSYIKMEYLEIIIILIGRQQKK